MFNLFVFLDSSVCFFISTTLCVYTSHTSILLCHNTHTYTHTHEQKAASNVRVFIVGSGPVGLRLAIDCLLLGSDVVVIEKRTSFSRHNVLHLWPFTIEDLRQLGAKKFYGKFCAGAIDHISKYH